MPTLPALALLAALTSTAGPTAAATPPPTPDATAQTAACVATHAFSAGGARLQLDFYPADFRLGATPLCAWTVRAANTVAAYFGRFPVPASQIRISAVDGGGVHGGTTDGDRGDGGVPLSVVRLGHVASVADLDDDWVMTHELVHLAVPSVPRRSHWLEEGIATYVEPVARVQSGELDAARIWRDMLQGMPKGEPAADDRGLDHTPTWGRTYWGGALYCLLADIEIRRRSGNRRGLQDALRGVLAAGGSIQRDWSVERWNAAADAATGVPVLAEQYMRMREQPDPVDLDALWKRLGVSLDGDRVRFDDNAEWAALRRAITAPAPR